MHTGVKVDTIYFAVTQMPLPSITQRLQTSMVL